MSLKKCLSFLGLILLLGCSEPPTTFSTEALNDRLLNVGGDDLSWNDVLKHLKGKKTVIDFWASWCRDCINGFEELNELKQQFPDINYVYISLDKKTDAWKWGITKYQLHGLHFYLKEGKNGGLGDFFNISYIPRYVVLDENNNILLFKALKASDSNIKKVLQ